MGVSKDRGTPKWMVYFMEIPYEQIDDLGVPLFLETPILLYPIPSMYGIFTYIYHRFKPNVGKYTSPMDPKGIAVNNSIYDFLLQQVFRCEVSIPVWTPMGTFGPTRPWTYITLVFFFQREKPFHNCG